MVDDLAMAGPPDAAHPIGREERLAAAEPDLRLAYERETARLLRGRLELSFAFFLLFMGIVVLVERRMPGHAGVVYAFLIEAVIGGTALLLTRVPRFELATRRIAVLAMIGLSYTMLIYSGMVQSPWDPTALGQVCLMACIAIVLPWGWRAQLALALSSLAGFALVMPLLDQNSPGVYILVALLTGATTSTFAAFFLDRYRFQAFARAVELTRAHALQQEEAEISGALLYVGQMLSQFVGRAELLEHVNRLVIDALGCDWSSTFVYDHERHRFRFVANVGSRTEVQTELESMDIPPESMPVFAELRDRRLVEIPDADAQELIPSDLLARWEMASMLCVPIYRNDRLIGVIGTGYLSRRGPFSRKQKRLLEGIGHAVAVGIDNERLIRDLRAANRLKSDFVATMSHELRTPLNVILGYAEMLDEAAHDSPQDVEQFADRIRRSARELLELVNATLDLGRMESGRDELRLERVRVGPLLAEIDGELEALARGRGLEVAWHDAVGATAIATDRVKLKTIVKNLVGNAIKYTPHGSVAVHAAIEDAVLVVSVRDTGVGIAADDLPTIFDMFRQVGSSATRSGGGVGLGLYIVRTLVDRLGGTVDVASTLGVGSEFTVRLPLHADADAAAGTRRTADTAAQARLSS